MPCDEQFAYKAHTAHTYVRAVAGGVRVSASEPPESLTPVEARAFADSIHTAADVAEAEAAREQREELEDFYVNGPKLRTVTLPSEGDKGGAA